MSDSERGDQTSGTGLNRRDLLKATAVGAGAAAFAGTMLSDINDGARADGEPIPIGFMTALTGWDAATGIEYERGLMLAIEEINEMGGILGRPVEHHAVDTKNRSADEVVGAANLLIDRHGVHAIVNGHNIGSQNAEYDPIGDAGIIYIHANTLIQHHEWVMQDPERFYGIFMGDPAEYWYGEAFIDMCSILRDTGQWRPQNNKIAIVAGSLPYSSVVAEGIIEAASKQGWEVAFGPEVVSIPTTEWGPVLAKVREANVAAIANTHFFPGDIAAFQMQFAQNPTNSLVWFPFGALLQAFTDVGEDKVEGVLTSTVLGLPQDEIGNAFRERYIGKYGAGSTPEVGCGPYDYLHHYAIAAALAGGTGEPGDYEQNRKIAMRLLRTIYRGVCGTSRYHPEWQATIPYPSHEKRDPSLGMPHLFYQVQDWQAPRALVAPPPYDASPFVLPPWMEQA